MSKLPPDPDEPQFDPFGEPGDEPDESIDDEPLDLFDPEALSYTDDELKYADVDVRKELTSIKVRKPGPKEWFRVHRSPRLKMKTALYLREDYESLTPEAYVVPPKYAGLFGKALTPAVLHLAINSLDTVFLWDRKLPRTNDSKRMAAYYESLRKAAVLAETEWVRLEWSNGNGQYAVNHAPEDLGDPQFPEKTMAEWLKLGFGDRIVTGVDNPVVLEYQGRKLIQGDESD